MSAEAACLAIDFGTCYSSAARMVDGRAEPVKDPLEHDYSIESSVVALPDGELVVGVQAERRKLTRARWYAGEFKRVLGQRQPLLLGDRELAVIDAVAAVLGFLKDKAQIEDGRAYERALITVPASYQADLEEFMRQAGREAGFAEVALLAEPVAAAMARSDPDAERDGQFVVYDLGGGTFDVALVQRSGDRFAVLGYDGLPDVGGVNFSRAIEADLAQQSNGALGQALAGLSSSDPDQWLKAKRTELAARDFCEQAKRMLSQEQHFEDILAVGDGLISYTLSREQLQALIDSDLQRTIDCCNRLVERCQRSWTDIDGIVLVGGSCRLPFIPERLTDAFDRPLLPVRDPELAVCLGAAQWHQHHTQAARAADEAHARRASAQKLALLLRARRQTLIAAERREAARKSQHTGSAAIPSAADLAAAKHVARLTALGVDVDKVNSARVQAKRNLVKMIDHPAWPDVVNRAGNDVGRRLVQLIIEGAPHERFRELSPCKIESWATSEGACVLTTRRVLLERASGRWVSECSYTRDYERVNRVWLSGSPGTMYADLKGTSWIKVHLGFQPTAARFVSYISERCSSP